jgi:hypothetical protein
VNTDVHVHRKEYRSWRQITYAWTFLTNEKSYSAFFTRTSYRTNQTNSQKTLCSNSLATLLLSCLHQLELKISLSCDDFRKHDREPLIGHVILCTSWLQSPGKVSWICDLRTTLCSNPSMVILCCTSLRGTVLKSCSAEIIHTWHQWTKCTK